MLYEYSTFFKITFDINESYFYPINIIDRYLTDRPYLNFYSKYYSFGV